MGQIIDAIVSGLASIIKFFAMVGGGNTAVGIILFTIAIRLAILPITLKAVRSSRYTMALQPKIKEINEKYKTKQGERLSAEKQQKKQQETMELYTKYGVNPASGCLPILIQIPIFFAVYAAVTRSVGDPALQLVQNAWVQFAPSAAKDALLDDRGFLWVPTLTRPDPTYIFPILMVLFQFTTQKMAIPRGGGADEQQRRLNNIMQYVPLIFGFTALNFPAGPVIYWVTTSIFSTVQQYFITGWGSLADVPGLGFLPNKEIKLPELKERAPSTNPGKKSLMERMMENQQKLQEQRGQIEVGKTESSSKDAPADASEDFETSVRNSFGRKADAKPETLRTSGSVKKIVAEPIESETRALNQEERIRQAYRANKQRPPKKGSSVTGNDDKKK